MFKHIGLTVMQLARQVWEIPQTIANAARQRQLRTIRDEHEAERLDRIRNPDKYRGK